MQGDNDRNGIRPTPLLIVDNSTEAQLVPLQTFLQSPSCSIAVVRGLTSQLSMDLSLYSTKSLLELIPDQSMEVCLSRFYSFEPKHFFGSLDYNHIIFSLLDTYWSFRFALSTE